MIRRVSAILATIAIILPLISEISVISESSGAPPASQEPPTPPLEVAFSRRSGFYDESFVLELSANSPNADIFYTLNGNPTSQCPRDSERFTNMAASPANDIPYTEPIAVTAGDSTDVLSVRAFAVLDGEFSPVVVHNFVKGVGVKSRFSDDMLIFVINGDPHGLYDFYDGIMVEGIDRQNWVDEFTQRHGRPPLPGPPNQGGEIALTRPANFNRRGRRSEREVHVAMFESDGTLRLSQRAGTRIKGGYSRAHPQKSLELYARESDYDVNRFDYPFFWENTPDGNIMNSYRRIRLRNGGSDRDGAFIRDEFSQALLRQAGFCLTQTHTPAAVFINGVYSGVSWLKSPRTENHLRRFYGRDTALTENFRIIKDSENGYGQNHWRGERDAIDDWWQIFNLARVGLGDDNRWQEFSSRVCIDSLMLYYAFQIYVQNLDWPNHNMQMWRYFPTPEELDNPDLHPFLRDGKWRWLPHDFDATWSFRNNALANINSIHNVLVGGGGSSVNPQIQGVSTVLASVLQRPEMRGRFANTFVDLIEGVCAPENAIAVFESLVARIQPEHEYALEAGLFDDIGNPATSPSVRVQGGREAIRDYALQRPDHMLAFIARPWAASTNSGLGFSQSSRRTLTMTTSRGGGAVMNSRTVSEDSTVAASYYRNTSVTITAKAYPGYSVSHWIVGRNRIAAADSITVDFTANTTVELHFVKSPDATLRITAISAAGGDWLEIHNPADTALTTRGLYLSDNSNLFRFRVPAVIIRPGETVRFATSANESLEPLKHCRTNFNLSFRETLRLTASDGTVLQAVDVTLLRRNQVQRMGRDGNWRVEIEVES